MIGRKVISSFDIAGTTICYLQDIASGRVGLQMYPSVLAAQIILRRTDLSGQPEIDAIPVATPPAAENIDSLFHLKILGDPYPGAFAQGRTMRNSPSIDTLKFDRQDIQGKTIITKFAAPTGYRLEHHLTWHDHQSAFDITTSFFNDSLHPVTLEMMTSFSLGGITPFHLADAPNRLRVHRFRSVWSAEARLTTETIEQLHLERSWSGAGLFSERFGQVGSMPVRGWFPFVAVEDTQTAVLWGAQLAWAGSWQMEIFRQARHGSRSGNRSRTYSSASRSHTNWDSVMAFQRVFRLIAMYKPPSMAEEGETARPGFYFQMPFGPTRAAFARGS